MSQTFTLHDLHILIAAAEHALTCEDDYLKDTTIPTGDDARMAVNCAKSLLEQFNLGISVGDNIEVKDSVTKDGKKRGKTFSLKQQPSNSPPLF